MSTEAGYETAVSRLRGEVEKAAGYAMITPKDFDALTERVLEQTGQRLSPTTLKRLWGYMRDGGKPRRSTLNILALYLGYASIEAFIEEATTEEKENVTEENSGTAARLSDIPEKTSDTTEKNSDEPVREHPSARKHLLRLAATVLLLVAVGALGNWGYHTVITPKVHYDIVARFQVGNLAYESWGGGLVAVRGVKSSDRCVEIPPSVKNDGVNYQVREITLNAFKDCPQLRSAVLPNSELDIMQGAFSSVHSLQQIVCRSATPPHIGNKFWPCDITDIFTAEQFKHVVIIIPKGSLAAYKASPWCQFSHLSEGF